MPDPTELARVLERAETMRDLLRVYGAHESDATENELHLGAQDGTRALADAARLLREIAADFDKYAIHGVHALTDRPDVGCEKDHQKHNGTCQCGLEAARAKWAL